MCQFTLGTQSPPEAQTSLSLSLYGCACTRVHGVSATAALLLKSGEVGSLPAVAAAVRILLSGEKKRLLKRVCSTWMEELCAVWSGCFWYRAQHMQGPTLEETRRGEAEGRWGHVKGKAVVMLTTRLWSISGCWSSPTACFFFCQVPEWRSAVSCLRRGGQNVQASGA